ncbi:hypothetical protein ACJJTC_005362, partial [Scirpophaga incertulas]
ASPGRPNKLFLDLSERSKRRKTEELRTSNIDELTYATQMKLREKGKVEASRIVKDLTKSPRRARKYAAAMKKSTLEEEQDKIMKLKHFRALFMYTEAGLTQAQYEIVRDTNPSFYPCYTILQKLKKECYPTIHRVTETCAEVTVQNLMDHTAQRLILHLGEGAVEQLTELEKQSLILISKWGCDGSQQMTYKMKFENEADSDANIFQTSMVPLQLVYGQDKKILWQNPVPSSPRYCRPIRIRFVKETIDIINEEIDYIKSQVASLNESEVQGLSVKHKMLFTMVDGKVISRIGVSSHWLADFSGLGVYNFVKQRTIQPSAKTTLEQLSTVKICALLRADNITRLKTVAFRCYGVYEVAWKFNMECIHFAAAGGNSGDA